MLVERVVIRSPIHHHSHLQMQTWKMDFLCVDRWVWNPEATVLDLNLMPLVQDGFPVPSHEQDLDLD